MTFETLENSNYDAIPVSLYEFKLGSTSWRYCTGDLDITVGGETYEALAISDDGTTQSGEPATDEMTIRVTREAGVNDLFIGSPPSESIFVTVRRKHVGDDEAPVHWAGTVKSTKLADYASREITCSTLLSSLGRNGLRLSWSRACPHVLYDRNCAADKSAFATTSSVASTSGNRVTIAALAAYDGGYFSGGFLQFINEFGAIESLSIESHVGAELVLIGTTDRFAVNQLVTVYPGCDRVSSTCETKFNNLDNYGGFPMMPNKSPFDGDPVF